MKLIQKLALALLALLPAAPAPAKTPAQPGPTTTAFLGAAVIDGSGAPPIPDAVLVVRDGRVAAVGPRASTPVPADARRVEVAGKTIVPGLVNAHGHVRLAPRSPAAPRDQLLGQLALYARYGVTTVFSLGDDGVESVKLRDALRAAAPAERPLVARLHVAGPSLEADTPAEARTLVAGAARLGVDVIKSRLEGPPDAPMRDPAVHGPLVAQAHAERLPVAFHVVAADEARAVVAAGADLVAHSIRDREADPALVAAMRDRGVGYIPTLTRDLSVYVYESVPAFAADPFFAREAAYRAPLAALLAPEAQAAVRASRTAQAAKPALAQARRNLKALSDAGVPIAMGTDSGAGRGRWQGYFEHLELELMVEAGLTPMQALVAATGGAARVMRVDADVGALQPGRRADLLVLGKNPLDDIRNTRTLEQVWIGGRRVDSPLP